MSEKDYDSIQNFSSLECWDYSIELECLQGTPDLQLAAELGKTLLERNKDLENSLKQHQNVIEDQSQEIEFLNKQTAALREANDSRLRMYEQLDISIQDLERANHRLALEHSADKKHIKNLTATIEALEIKCEELQGTIDDLNLQLNTYKRKALKSSDSTPTRNADNRRLSNYEEETNFRNRPISPDTSQLATEDRNSNRTEKSTDESNNSQNVSDARNQTSFKQNEKETLEEEIINEQITQLLTQLREIRTLYSREQRRVSELEEQLSTMVQQNQSLEKQLVQKHFKDEEAKSMHEELTTLEEVRQGQLCSRCLRTIDSPRTGDNMSCLGDEPEDDDASMLEALTDHSQHRTSFHMDIQDYGKTPPTPIRHEPNLYRDLVEKYEALLEMQRTQSSRNQKSNSLSLHEEMQMSGNFNHSSTKDTDEESGHGDSLQPEKQIKKERKTFSQTPTDFSEAETSSSGFSDETSNKATQTDGRPGSFLCSIADGEDCKFSIYDDTSPIDSRFRNRPEYRELFSEIFTVLKKAAENKDEGEDLPLLDDHTPVKSVPNVPPATPSAEELPDFPDNFTDDTQSVLSSTMSELSTNQIENLTITEDLEAKTTEIEITTEDKKEELILTPYVRQPLEYLSVSVNVRKRSSSRRKKQLAERSDSPATPILGSPKVTYSSRPSSGRKRKEIRNPVKETNNAWDGNTLHFFSRTGASPTPTQNNMKSCRYENRLDYRPSTASQDLFKLKRLDLSYAEVLRNADNKKREREAASRYRRK